MKHYAVQNNLSLGAYKVRPTRAKGRKRTTNAVRKQFRERPVSDEMAAWALKVQPELAMMVMLGE